MPQRKSQRLNTFVLPPFRRNVQTIDARKVGITTGSLAGVDHPIDQVGQFPAEKVIPYLRQK